MQLKLRIRSPSQQLPCSPVSSGVFLGLFSGDASPRGIYLLKRFKLMPFQHLFQAGAVPSRQFLSRQFVIVLYCIAT